MNFYLEVIIPPVPDVSGAIKNILEQFDRNKNPNGFHDGYIIGGGCSGVKLSALLGRERIAVFRFLLQKEGITISRIQNGKPELYPASQITLVDKLWREHFPDSGVNVCPLFRHYNTDNQLEYPDIMTVGEMGNTQKAFRVIIAAPNASGNFEAAHMEATSMWNGVNFVKTEFDGDIRKMINDFNESSLTDYKVTDDWLAVTVEYHS